MRRRRRGIVRSAALRRDAFSLLNGIYGIEVGRVLGQIAKRSAARFDRFAYASRFVRRKIVDHDDILALEGRGQTLFDVGQKLGSIHWTINSARRSHAIAAKRGHKGDGLPMPLRHTANQALTARATTA